MKTELPLNSPLRHCLRSDRFLRFEHPRGLRLRAEQGALWVTVDGEPDDITIEPGDCRVFDTDRSVLVGSFRGAAVVSASLPKTPKSAPRWRQWFGRATPRVQALA